MCEEGGRDGEGLAAWAEGHVAPNEVSACHGASHQTVNRHAHFLNSTPCEKEKERTCRQTVSKTASNLSAQQGKMKIKCGNIRKCQVLERLLTYPTFVRKYKSIKHERSMNKENGCHVNDQDRPQQNYNL